MHKLFELIKKNHLCYAIVLWLLILIISFLNQRTLFADASFSMFNVIHSKNYDLHSYLRDFYAVIQFPIITLLKVFGTKLSPQTYLWTFQILFLATLLGSLYILSKITKSYENRFLYLIGAIASHTMVFSFQSDSASIAISFFWPMLAYVEYKNKTYLNLATIGVFTILSTYTYEPIIILLMIIMGAAFLKYRREHKKADLIYTLFFLYPILRIILFFLNLPLTTSNTEVMNTFQKLGMVPLLFSSLAIIPLFLGKLPRQNKFITSISLMGLILSLWIFHEVNIYSIFHLKTGSFTAFIPRTLIILIGALFFYLNYKIKIRNRLDTLAFTVLIFSCAGLIYRVYKTGEGSPWNYQSAKIYAILACIPFSLPILFKLFTQDFKKCFFYPAFTVSVITLFIVESKINYNWYHFRKKLYQTSMQGGCITLPRKIALAWQNEGGHPTYYSHFSVLLQNTWSPRGIVFSSNLAGSSPCFLRPIKLKYEQKPIQSFGYEYFQFSREDALHPSQWSMIPSTETYTFKFDPSIFNTSQE